MYAMSVCRLVCYFTTTPQSLFKALCLSSLFCAVLIESDSELLAQFKLLSSVCRGCGGARMRVVRRVVECCAHVSHGNGPDAVHGVVRGGLLLMLRPGVLQVVRVVLVRRLLRDGGMQGLRELRLDLLDLVLDDLLLEEAVEEAAPRQHDVQDAQRRHRARTHERRVGPHVVLCKRAEQAAQEEGEDLRDKHLQLPAVHCRLLVDAQHVGPDDVPQHHADVRQHPGNVSRPDDCAGERRAQAVLHARAGGEEGDRHPLVMVLAHEHGAAHVEQTHEDQDDAVPVSHHEFVASDGRACQRGPCKKRSDQTEHVAHRRELPLCQVCGSRRRHTRGVRRLNRRLQEDHGVDEAGNEREEAAADDEPLEVLALVHGRCLDVRVQHNLLLHLLVHFGSAALRQLLRLRRRQVPGEPGRPVVVVVRRTVEAHRVPRRQPTVLIVSGVSGRPNVQTERRHHLHALAGTGRRGLRPVDRRDVHGRLHNAVVVRAGAVPQGAALVMSGRVTVLEDGLVETDEVGRRAVSGRALVRVLEGRRRGRVDGGPQGALAGHVRCFAVVRVLSALVLPHLLCSFILFAFWGVLFPCSSLFLFLGRLPSEKRGRVERICGVSLLCC
eukprot:Rhum_TRINITY_DN11202_c1_g1::Rhum_TRINITY_DN11202_c1_g1_i1::g.43272::m.43272